MNIFINGKSIKVPTQTTAAQLLEILNLAGKRLAMEVNEEIVPRSTFTQYHFSAGDKIEIVHAIGGG